MLSPTIVLLAGLLGYAQAGVMVSLNVGSTQPAPSPSPPLSPVPIPTVQQQQTGGPTIVPVSLDQNGCFQAETILEAVPGQNNIKGWFFEQGAGLLRFNGPNQFDGSLVREDQKICWQVNLPTSGEYQIESYTQRASRGRGSTFCDDSNRERSLAKCEEEQNVSECFCLDLENDYWLIIPSGPATQTPDGTVGPNEPAKAMGNCEPDVTCKKASLNVHEGFYPTNYYLQAGQNLVCAVGRSENMALDYLCVKKK